MDYNRIFEYTEKDIVKLQYNNNFIDNYFYPDNLSLKELMQYPDIPYMQVFYNFPMPYEDIMKEILPLKDHFIYHRSKEPHKGWSSIVLHGLSSIHTQSPENYGYTNENAPYIWTDVSKYCPILCDFIKKNFVYEKYFRIRIMKLEPKGIIYPHIDGGFNHIGPINIAINNPKKCNFYMDGHGIIPFEDKLAFSVNIGSKLHFVVNNSKEDRYHVILHGTKSDICKQVIYKSYKKIKNYD